MPPPLTPPPPQVHLQLPAPGPQPFSLKPCVFPPLLGSASSDPDTHPPCRDPAASGLSQTPAVPLKSQASAAGARQAARPWARSPEPGAEREPAVPWPVRSAAAVLLRAHAQPGTRPRLGLAVPATCPPLGGGGALGLGVWSRSRLTSFRLGLGNRGPRCWGGSGDRQLLSPTNRTGPSPGFPLPSFSALLRNTPPPHFTGSQSGRTFRFKPLPPVYRRPEAQMQLAYLKSQARGPEVRGPEVQRSRGPRPSSQCSVHSPGTVSTSLYFSSAPPSSSRRSWNQGPFSDPSLLKQRSAEAWMLLIQSLKVSKASFVPTGPGRGW